MKPSDVLMDRLPQIRKAKGWTQRDLVNRLRDLGIKMDPATVARIEKGARRVSLDEALQLAAALEVSPLHLFLPKGDPKQKVQVAPKLTTTTGKVRAWIRTLQPLPGQDRGFMLEQATGDDFARSDIPDLVSRVTELQRNTKKLQRDMKELQERTRQLRARGET